MNRQEKKHTIDQLKDKFEASKAAFAVNYRGLSVCSLTSLRKQLRAENGVMQVAKITLLKRALSESPAHEPLSSVLEDQVALVFSKGEPPAVAKVLEEFSKEFEQLKVLGGVYDAGLLSAQDVKVFSSLPSREVLLARLLAQLNAPASRMVFALNGVMLKLLFVLKKIGEQKQG